MYIIDLRSDILAQLCVGVIFYTRSRSSPIEAVGASVPCTGSSYLTYIDPKSIAPCCLFLSAKLEEQPRKLEHVIKVANICLQKNEHLDPKSEAYLQQAQDLVINESILLQTLGFELTVDHPHTHVVRITQLVRASKDLAQTSYFMATNSLHLTPFCIEHKPSVVACVCIHLACKWSNWEFPRSSDNKDWWEYVDPTVTKQSLDTICQEFLTIIENCPNRLKRRISTVTIYKGGHRPKTAGEKSGKNVAPTNGNASTSKEESSSKSENSSKGEPSNSESLKRDHSTNNDSSSAIDTSTKQLNEQICKKKNSNATLTITSSAAVVETPTSTVVLPSLPPLTTRYANVSNSSSSMTHENQVKIASNNTKSSGGNKDDKVISGTKHKQREHDESLTPAKKLKTVHSGSSHSSQSKHPSSSNRPPSQSKHNSSHLPSKPGFHSTPGSHHKLPTKSGSTNTGQPHRSSSPKPTMKSSSANSSHAHRTSSSSAHGNSSTHSHHSSNKRHGHSASSHTNSHPSGSKLPTLHRHSGSPLDAKKSSGDRHRRPSSSFMKPRPDMPASAVPSNDRSSDTDKTKKNVSEDFASPPGPQRVQKFPPQRPINITDKTTHHAGPPLPSSAQATPPPPPLPTNLPPPPPPPPT
ncbi:cyclin-T1-like isoform X2 [Dendronephthya gigantea]|uniref:cyclin-T1-like isoform X2 n=1 Tax=Dendronephthya gigantea TaxID=151771 RepID=UPI00106CFBE1|nr:cyclin-T1-like isoform X2 [Dendronephthya gigantea]